MSTLLFIIATVIALLTTDCSHQGSNNDPAYAPEINPHPKHFMTVKGHIDPNLINKIKLQIISEYETTDPKCQYVVNPIEGIYLPFNRIITTTIDSDNQGDGQIKIPLDYYVPGKCNWQVYLLSFNPLGSGFSPINISYFSNPSVLPKNFDTEKTTYISCDQHLNCFNRGYGQYGADLPTNHNYVYKINIFGP